MTKRHRLLILVLIVVIVSALVFMRKPSQSVSSTNPSVATTSEALDRKDDTTDARTNRNRAEDERVPLVKDAPSTQEAERELRTAQEDELWKKRGYTVDDVPLFMIDARAQKIYLQLYFDLFGSFPTGDTPAVIRALQGENPKKLNLFPPTLENPEKHFRDSYGNFVALRLGKGRDEIEIRSAGPNRVFMDADDEVVGPFASRR